MGTVGPPRTSSPSSGCKHRRARRIAGFILGDIVGPVRADSSVVRALPDGRPTRALGFECGLQLLMRPRCRASLPGSAEKPSARPGLQSDLPDRPRAAPGPCRSVAGAAATTKNVVTEQAGAWSLVPVWESDSRRVSCVPMRPSNTTVAEFGDGADPLQPREGRPPVHGARGK